MLELAFNELSVTPVATKAEAFRALDDFFSILDEFNNLKIAPVRLRSYVDIAVANLADEFFTFKDWLRTKESEVRTRYLGYIGQEPLIDDDPYFKFDGKYVIGFGYASEMDLSAVSLHSPGTWKGEEYKLERESLVGDPDPEIIVDEASAKHCPSVKHVKALKDWLFDGYQTRQNDIAENIDSIAKLWKAREEIFPWLTFCPGVEGMLLSYESVKNPEFKKARNYLHRLNEHLARVAQKQAQFDEIPGDKSLESEGTLNEFGGLRDFDLPDGSSKRFSLHSKLGGNLRIHLYPFQADGKYAVGYVGVHLPTKNFAK